MVKDLLDAAGYACDMFDQVDTGRAVESLGARGRLVRAAIEELKRQVLLNGGTVILPPPTEQYRSLPRRSSQAVHLIAS